MARNDDPRKPPAPGRHRLGPDKNKIEPRSGSTKHDGTTSKIGIKGSDLVGKRK